MKLLFTPVFFVLFLFVSCGVPDDGIVELRETNAVLQAKNDSLLEVIQQLQQSPDDVLTSAKQLMAAGKKDSAVLLLTDLSRRSLTPLETSAIARLLKVPKGKIKGRKGTALAASNIGVKDKTTSLYQADGNVNNLSEEHKVEHNWSVETTTPVIKRPVQEKTYRVRTGAICRDGTRSYATGRGACSHHGGVSEWVVE